MLVVALALSGWGRPRATLDIDFMILTGNIPDKLVTGLSRLGFDRDLMSLIP